MTDLERFHQAQRDPHAGFDAALREIQSGGKRGHWIWYIFPQLAGLGYSGMSRTYAIRDLAEAEAYLRDETLGSRLTAIATAVRDALSGGRSMVEVMGSSIDAAKLVSSVTLFAGVARRMPRGSVPAADALLPIADDILNAATRAGHVRCAKTERVLAGAEEPPRE